jgi:hypothetical protein
VRSLQPDSDVCLTPSLKKISPACQANLPQARIADSKFQKRSQLFIRAHNEPLIVAAMRVNNPDRSPIGVGKMPPNSS